MAYTVPNTLASAIRQFTNDSLAGFGQATGPAGNAVIATVTPPIAGVYSVQVLAGYADTAVAAPAERFNMNLRVDGTVFVTLPVLAVANTLIQCGTYILTVNGTQAITVNAIAAATGTAIYVALLTPTRLR